MIFVVVYLAPLTVCINCSFFIYVILLFACQF